MIANRAKCKTKICLVWLVTARKDEVFEADNVESKWNAMKGVWQKATEQVYGWTKNHRGIVRHGGGMKR